MGSVDERLSAQFHEWERSGRGWQVWPMPVVPEPPFRPFLGHHLPRTDAIDDGRRPTFLSSLVQRLARRLEGAPESAPPAPHEDEEPEPRTLIRDSLAELRLVLPADLDVKREVFEQFVVSLSLCREPIAFELLGVPGSVTTLFVADHADAPSVERELGSYFPDATAQPSEGTLAAAWVACVGEETLIVEFGLSQEFMFPLAAARLDPFISLVGALSALKAGELGVFQVIYEPLKEPWADSIVRSVTHSDGRPFFVNRPELAKAAQAKAARPLYGAVVRIAAKASTYERTVEIARDMAGSLSVFSLPQGNELIPLENADYAIEDHVEDMLARQTRRSGMILTLDELLGFVHLPSASVRSPGFARHTGRSKRAPASVLGSSGVLLGENRHLDEACEVRLTNDRRVYHTHVIGASGTGKSTLLFNMIRQDIESGEGVAVLDPHGDLIDRILGVIPPERVNDVVLVDPSDEAYSVGFNILSAHSDLEKNLLASDLVSVFQRLSASWGDQMGSVLQNAILAFLESSEGGTLSDLRRFLIEPVFRNQFLATVRDPDIVYYWRKAFVQLSGNKSIGSVLTRLETFLAPKPIRYMVSQTENRLDFGSILDTGKILLAKLPQGLMGKENSFLLGSLLVAKLQQLVMGRQAQQESLRRDFWLYIDEFQNFITPSMAEILSGARKYRLGLILAHQELRQLDRDRDVASAVLTNPATRIVFRVSDADARSLESGFSYFEGRDLQNLATGEAIARFEKADGDFNLSIPNAIPVPPDEAKATRQAVVDASRKAYATARGDIEAALRAKHDGDEPEPGPDTPAPGPPIPPKPGGAGPRPREKPTDTEKKTVPNETHHAPPVISVPPPKPAEAAPPVIREKVTPKDLGRGGAQHLAIQKRIKKAAEAVGFRSTIEKEVLDGKGSIDVLLERDGATIACEISITTTVDHEVGNVVKCLKAGFSRVAMIALDAAHLEKIRSSAAASLGTEAVQGVGYFAPDEFIELLATLKLAPQPQMPRMSRGYKVKRSAPKLTVDEQKQRESAAVRSIADVLNRPKGET